MPVDKGCDVRAGGVLLGRTVGVLLIQVAKKRCLIHFVSFVDLVPGTSIAPSPFLLGGCTVQCDVTESRITQETNLSEALSHFLKLGSWKYIPQTSRYR